MITFGEHERNRKEAAMAYFRVLFRNLLGGTEKKYRKSQDCWYFCQGFNWAPTKYIQKHYLSFIFLRSTVSSLIRIGVAIEMEQNQTTV
jgi:hypothetical protein